MTFQTEQERVKEISRNAGYGEGVDEFTVKYSGEIFRRHMIEGSVLELGPAGGLMTDLLSMHYDDYTVVDGADFFVQAILDRHPKITGIVSLFEDFMPERSYDNIVLGHVLEHVENPVDILKKCRSWLSEGGVVVAAVPNSHSIHRQAAVYMKLLQSEKQLNETDHKNGHRRVYDIELLRKNFLDADLKIIQSGGYWLKPVSNAQIDATWTEDMLQAFLQLGEKYPDIAGEIYVIAAK